MQYEPQIIPRKAAKRFSVRWGEGLLLRSTNWLGDALMTLPAAWQLSRALPAGSRFAVLCPAALAPLWEAAPWVTDVIGMRGNRVSSEEAGAVKALHPDAGIVFPNSFGSALDLWRCGIPRRIGRRGRWRAFLLTDTIPEWPRAKGAGKFHQLSWYLELVSTLADVTAETAFPALKIDTELALRLGMTEEDRWLLVAPGAAYGPAKQWPVEYFAEIARRWSAAGGRVVAVGSARESRLTKAIADAAPRVLDLGGRTGLAQLMAVCRLSRRALCNDSGAMHLAAACGTSGIAVFGSTDPVATGPLGAPWRLLVSDAPCRPCLRRDCSEAEPYHCLKRITPELVWDEWER